MYITLKTNQVTTCDKCNTKDKQYTYKVGREHFCLCCAARKVLSKSTKITTSLIQQFDNKTDYESVLSLVENTIKNGHGPRAMRVRAAKIAAGKTPVDIRHLGHGKYVILCPAGKRIFEALSPMNPDLPRPEIDPDNPFKSICTHVQNALNSGLAVKDVAEYIWSIRGKYDYITAMMYEDHVVVTWPHGQRTLKPCLKTC